MLDGIKSFFSAVGQGASGLAKTTSDTIGNLNLDENAGVIIPLLQGANIIRDETLPPKTVYIREAVEEERRLNLSPASVLPWVAAAAGIGVGVVILRKVFK